MLRRLQAKLRCADLDAIADSKVEPHDGWKRGLERGCRETCEVWLWLCGVGGTLAYFGTRAAKPRLTGLLHRASSVLASQPVDFPRRREADEPKNSTDLAR